MMADNVGTAVLGTYQWQLMQYQVRQAGPSHVSDGTGGDGSSVEHTDSFYDFAIADDSAHEVYERWKGACLYTADSVHFERDNSYLDLPLHINERIFLATARTPQQHHRKFSGHSGYINSSL
jgi:hypothetical protein